MICKLFSFDCDDCQTNQNSHPLFAPPPFHFISFEQSLKHKLYQPFAIAHLGRLRNSISKLASETLLNKPFEIFSHRLMAERKWMGTQKNRQTGTGRRQDRDKRQKKAEGKARDGDNRDNRDRQTGWESASYGKNCRKLQPTLSVIQVHSITRDKCLF